MQVGRQDSLVRSIQTLFDAGTTGGLTDAQLLDRFFDREGERAEAAFEALVVRHGPVVLEVCRRVLGAGHDAEDAFQATFLILACKKAGSIRRRDALGSWLFGVARRVAVRSRADAVRRRVHERRAAELRAEEVGPAETPMNDSALIEEVHKLPAKYREPVILCDLHGITYEAAAQRLGCPLGTLSVRLKRARERLRTRLTRRGVSDAGGWLAAGFAPTAVVPPALVTATVGAAVRVALVRALGAGVASATVLKLTQGVLKTMFLNRLKLVVAGLMPLALGAGLWAWHAAAATDEPAPAQVRQAPSVPEPSKETKAVAKYQMAGTVRDEATGEPIAGAKIDVMTGDSSKTHRGTNQITLSGKDGTFRVDLPPGNARAWTLTAPVGYWAIANNKNIESFTLTKDVPVYRKDYLVRRGTVWDFRINRGAKAEPVKWSVRAFEMPNSYSSTVEPSGRIRLTLPTEKGKVRATAMEPIGGDMVQFDLEWESGFRPDALQSVANLDGSPVEFRLTDDQGKTATIKGAEQGRAVPEIDGGKLVVEVAMSDPDAKKYGDLAGTVVDSSGAPIAEARVALVWVEEHGGSGMGLDRHRVTTDTEGRFRIRAIPRGQPNGKPVTLQLAVTKEGYAGIDTQSIRFQPPEGDSPQVLKTVTLEAGASVTGTVIASDGTPLAGVWVEPGGSYANRSQFTKTGDDGRFTVHDLPVGMVPLHFSYGKLFAAGKYVVDRNPDSLTITLRPIPDAAQLKAQADAAKAARPKPIAVGAIAPEWEVGEWSDGKTRRLADYRGKVVFLDFWGIWCGPCLHALPAVEKARAKYEPLGVVFLTVHTPGETEKSVRKVLDLKKASLAFAFDRNRSKDDDLWKGSTAERYGVGGYPTSLIIDREGKIAYSSSDPGNMPAMMAIIKDMGIDPKTVNEEQASRMIERILDQAIDRVLNSPARP